MREPNPMLEEAWREENERHVEGDHSEPHGLTQRAEFALRAQAVVTRHDYDDAVGESSVVDSGEELAHQHVERLIDHCKLGGSCVVLRRRRSIPRKVSQNRRDEYECMCMVFTRLIDPLERALQGPALAI